MIPFKHYQLRAGNLKNLQIHEDHLPPPGPLEVSVAVKAIGLNFADIFAIWGLYKATPKGEFTPGLEYAGEIVAVGEEVRDFAVGDQVMGVTRFGGYTSHINIDYRYLSRLPSGWTFSEGAAFLVQVITAYYGLVYLGNLQENQTVLIHSGGGGVGLLANRIAKRYHAFTIGTIGSAHKTELLKEEGYDRIIVRDPKQFEQQLQEALDGRPLHLIMDSIGGRIFKAGYRQLAPMGRIIVFGSARYGSVGNRPNYLRLLYYYLTRPRFDPQKLPEDNKSIMGFNLIWLYNETELFQRITQEIAAMDLPAPHIGHEFPFEALPAAIKLFQSGKTVGKVIIKV